MFKGWSKAKSKATPAYEKDFARRSDAKPVRVPTDIEGGVAHVKGEAYAQLLEKANFADTFRPLQPLLEEAVVGSCYSSMDSFIRNRRGNHLVVMADDEYEAWKLQRNLPVKTAAQDMQDMRKTVSNLGTAVKRLEMRFGSNMDEAVRQQHRLDQLWYDAGDRRTDGAVVLRRLRREMETLTQRVWAVHSKAEAGVVPYCGLVMDLQVDAAGEGENSADGSEALLSIGDVVKGYTPVSLMEDVLAKRDGTINAMDLARLTYNRCSSQLKQRMGEPKSDEGQPRGMIRHWLAWSADEAFQNDQIVLSHQMQERAYNALAEWPRDPDGRLSKPSELSEPSEPSEPSKPSKPSKPFKTSKSHKPPKTASGGNSGGSGGSSSSDSTAKAPAAAAPRRSQSPVWWNRAQTPDTTPSRASTLSPPPAPRPERTHRVPRTASGAPPSEEWMQNKSARRNVSPPSPSIPLASRRTVHDPAAENPQPSTDRQRGRKRPWK